MIPNACISMTYPDKVLVPPDSGEKGKVRYAGHKVPDTDTLALPALVIRYSTIPFLCYISHHPLIPLSLPVIPSLSIPSVLPFLLHVL